MYESYTRQSLPTKEYRELLGSAICVFNSNTGFIIENLIHAKTKENWYELTDKTSEKLQIIIDKTLGGIAPDVCNSYRELTKKRNRIVHSFRITSRNNEQILATKEKVPSNKQFYIDEKYMLDFIKENQKLSDRLYEVRDILTK